MRFFSRRNLFFILLAVVLTIAAYLIVVKPMFEQKNRTQVVLTRHQDFVIATGSVEARDDVILSFEDGGSVEKIHYSAGDSVSHGVIIASLDADSLHAEVEAQRLRVNQEVIRLNSFVVGPEENERSRVRANVTVSEKMLDSEVRVSLVSAQQVAGKIENTVRTKFDTLFDGNVRDLRFKVNISAVDKQRVNKIRNGFENVFSRWRVWMNSNDSTYLQVITILRQLEKDLRLMHGGVVEIYDLILPFRFAQSEDDNVFLLSAQMRDSMVSAIVDVTTWLSAVETAESKYQLALAQSEESLAGSTQSDQKTQIAQVDIEKRRLQQIELQLEKTQIQAPFSGVVGEIFINEGEFVPLGFDAVRLISQDGFDLSVDVTEVEIQDVTLNQEMKAYIEVGGAEVTVRVRTIDATEKRTNDVPVYTVVFDILSKDIPLRPGMTVDVYIPSGEATDVFSVPRSAVVIKNSQEYVLIERGGDSMLIPVVVGAPLDNGSVAVTGELFSDDVVVFNKDDDQS